MPTASPGRVTAWINRNCRFVKAWFPPSEGGATQVKEDAGVSQYLEKPKDARQLLDEMLQMAPYNIPGLRQRYFPVFQDDDLMVEFLEKTIYPQTRMGSQLSWLSNDQTVVSLLSVNRNATTQWAIRNPQTIISMDLFWAAKDPTALLNAVIPRLALAKDVWSANKVFRSWKSAPNNAGGNAPDMLGRLLDLMSGALVDLAVQYPRDMLHLLQCQPDAASEWMTKHLDSFLEIVAKVEPYYRREASHLISGDHVRVIAPEIKRRASEGNEWALQYVNDLFSLPDDVIAFGDMIDVLIPEGSRLERQILPKLVGWSKDYRGGQARFPENTNKFIAAKLEKVLNAGANPFDVDAATDVLSGALETTRNTSIETLFGILGLGASGREGLIKEAYAKAIRKTGSGYHSFSSETDVISLMIKSDLAKEAAHEEVPKMPKHVVKDWMLISGHALSGKDSNAGFMAHWKNSSRSPGSMSYALACHGLFSDKDTAFWSSYDGMSSENLQRVLPPQSLSANQEHFMSLYDKTQGNIVESLPDAKPAFVDGDDADVVVSPDKSMVLLFRGIEKAYGRVDKNGQTLHGTLESWTSNPDTARHFDGAGLLRAWVPTTAILSHYLDPDWGLRYGPDDHDCEYEFIVIMANVPKENIEFIDKYEGGTRGKVVIPPLPASGANALGRKEPA